MGRAGLAGSDGRRGIVAVKGISGNGGKDGIRSSPAGLDPKLELDNG